MTRTYLLCRPLLGPLVVSIALAMIPVTTFAGSTVAKSKDATALVQALGSGRFSERERAMSELIHRGLDALDAVEKGTHSEDREIRFRCQRIAKIIQADDFQQRLRAFASGGKTGRRIKLPSWKRFAQQIGSDDIARRLFVEMQKSEPELMRMLEESPSRAYDALVRRVTEIQNSVRFNVSGRFNQVQMGTVAAILFVANNQTRSYPLQTAQYISSCLQFPAFRSALEAGEERDLLRKMLGTWIAHCSGWSAYQGMMIAMQYNIPQGLVAAKRILHDVANQPNQPYFRYYALLAIGKFGNTEDIPVVEKFLEDKALCGIGVPINGKTRYRTQIRDVALAVLVHLTKQDPKKFGFDHLRKSSMYVFDPNSLAYASDDQRVAAIKKWRTYWQQHRKKHVKNGTDTAPNKPSSSSSSAG